MKNSVNFQHIRVKTITKLFDCLNVVLVNDQNFKLNEDFKKANKNEHLYFKILINSVFECIYNKISTIKPDKNFSVKGFDKRINERLQSGGINSVKNYKDQLQDNFYNTILSEYQNYSNLELFSFNNQNKFLSTVEIVKVFESQIHPFRLEKFQYLISKEDHNNQLYLDTLVNLNNAFPDAYKKFIKLIKNRIAVFYINEIISYLEENEEQFKLKGNLEIFKPDGEFKKIFNDDDEIPKLIYEFLDKQPEDFFQPPNFSRLRNILEHSKYNDSVLLKNSEYARSTFNSIVGEYLGTEFNYKDEASNSLKKLNELKENLKKMSESKGLKIRYNHS